MTMPQIIYLPVALVLCVTPANLFIRWFMRAANIPAGSGGDESLLRAGRIIGALERVLALLFIMGGHFEAVGFIFAAKSILRFKDADTAKTEYLLVGSLLSFLIAVALGTVYGFLA